MCSFLKLAVAIGGLVVAVSFAEGSPETDASGREPVIVHAHDLQWQVAEGLPAGSQMAVLFGDPVAAGPLVIRLRVPANSRIAPHFHPKDEWVTMIEGTGKMGFGSSFDLSTAEDFGAGDLHFLPAREVHYVQTLTASTVEIHTTGPWGLTFVTETTRP